MEQIRESQIIPTSKVAPNPYVSPPRDYRLNTDSIDILDTLKPVIQETLVSDDTNTSGANYGDAVNDAAQLPAVPHIISIKEQIVNVHDDGTTTIDVVLNVEDVKDVTEYDIRVAKDAGNL